MTTHSFLVVLMVTLLDAICSLLYQNKTAAIARHGENTAKAIFVIAIFHTSPKAERLNICVTWEVIVNPMATASFKVALYTAPTH